MSNPATVSVRPFGVVDGQSVDLVTLTNAAGMKAEITNWGATIVSLTAPDRDGKLENITIGYDNLEDYLTKSRYFGTVVGRYGNRIANARFDLDGVTYHLAANNGKNSLHGGLKGFDKQVWQTEVSKDSVTFTYVSADGEEGYPGELTSKVTYTLTDEQALKIDYEITTKARTVANLTNHAYFNLQGEQFTDILDHQIWINADRFTPTDDGAIPTGELRSVEGTPFDFRGGGRIGDRIDEANEQLVFAGGYDHNYVLNEGGDYAVQVVEPVSGRRMTVTTTEPGVQFYSGNFLDGSNSSPQGRPFIRRCSFCLETQHFPDSPNHPEFPTTVINPGEVYRSTTTYRFDTVPA